MSQALQIAELKDEIVEVHPSYYQKLPKQCLAVADDLEALKNRCRVLERILSYREIEAMILVENLQLNKF